MSLKSSLDDYITQFRNKRIMIIGDTIVDHFIYGTTSKISPDAPVPLVDVNKEDQFIGSLAKGIQFVQKFGGDVDVVTNIGNDFEGDHILEELRGYNIGLKGIFRFGSSTSKISRIIARDQQLLRLEKRQNIEQKLVPKMNTEIQAYIETRMEHCDAILILDYNMGMLNQILISQILNIAKQHGKPIIVRPEDKKYYLYKEAYILAMSRPMASSAIGVNPINETSMRIIGTKILNELRSAGVFIYYVEQDSYLFHQDIVKRFPSLLNYRAKSYTNIGSAITTLLSLMSAANAPIEQAVELAFYAGTLAAKRGREELFGIKELKEVIHDGKNCT